MPFTTYHLGSALLVGYILRRKVCWVTLLICSAFVVDIEPVAVLFTGIRGDIHGHAHSFLASVSLGALVGYALYLARGYVRRLFTDLGLYDCCDSLRPHVLGGIVGWFIHVLMDAPIYSDIKPFRPFSVNLLYAPQYSVELYAIYGLLFFAGSTIYLVYLYKITSSTGTLGTARVMTGLSAVGLGVTAFPIRSLDMCAAFLTLTPSGLYLVTSGLATMFSIYRTRLKAVLAFLLISLALYSTRYFRFVSGQSSLVNWIPASAINLTILLSYAALLAAMAVAYPVIRDTVKMGRNRLFTSFLVSLVVGLATAPIGVGLIMASIGYLGLLLTSRRVLASIEEYVSTTHRGLLADSESSKPTVGGGRTVSALITLAAKFSSYGS